jgi:hypothetical protein
MKVWAAGPAERLKGRLMQAKITAMRTRILARVVRGTVGEAFVECIDKIP